MKQQMSGVFVGSTSNTVTQEDPDCQIWVHGDSILNVFWGAVEDQKTPPSPGLAPPKGGRTALFLCCCARSGRNETLT